MINIKSRKDHLTDFVDIKTDSGDVLLCTDMEVRHDAGKLVLQATLNLIDIRLNTDIDIKNIVFKTPKCMAEMVQRDNIKRKLDDRIHELQQIRDKL
jgi:hypothetical protein